MAENVVVLTRQDTVGTITINRPSQRNALNLPVRESIIAAVHEFNLDADIRVLVLRGAGNMAFASGADLRELGSLNSVSARAHFEEFDNLLRTIESSPLPIIAMVDGFALGGGCELAAACDLRVASDLARFGIPIGRIGHSVDKANIRRLLRLVSPAELKAMLLTDHFLNAADAHRIGLVNWVVPAARVESFTYRLAETVSRKAPLGARAAKKQIDEVVDERYRPSGHEDDNIVADLFDTDDFAEGVAAFIGKREPRFHGR